MKPQSYSPAHKLPTFAELVCSNSLKAERFRLGSRTAEVGDGVFRLAYRAVGKKNAVPAGGALAVDRVLFSKQVTEAIKSDPNITVVTGEVENIDPDEYTIIATGPLTSGRLAGLS